MCSISKESLLLSIWMYFYDNAGSTIININYRFHSLCNRHWKKNIWWNQWLFRVYPWNIDNGCREIFNLEDLAYKMHKINLGGLLTWYWIILRPDACYGYVLYSSNSKYNFVWVWRLWWFQYSPVNSLQVCLLWAQWNLMLAQWEDWWNVQKCGLYPCSAPVCQ